MRRRTPIKIRNGKVYVWAKANAKDLTGISSYYRAEKGYPAYILMPSHTAIKLKRRILSYPRATGVTTMGEDICSTYL